MGMCFDEFGRISIEVRRESFIIHPNDEAWNQRTPQGVLRANEHPEFYLSDLDDLIEALEDARDYLKVRDKATFAVRSFDLVRCKHDRWAPLCIHCHEETSR